MNYAGAAITFMVIVLGAGCFHSPEQESLSNLRRGLAAVFAPPSLASIPGHQGGEQIRLGYEIVVHTQEYAAPYVGNALNCTNCHLDAGLDPNSASFVGLSRVYPEYRERARRTITLAERINECFERSLNGKPLPENSHKLRAIVAYIDWLSQDIPAGMEIQWRGIPKMALQRTPDHINGEKVFRGRCAYCHGADGAGTFAAPPLWGPKSYNVGASMAQTSVAASFIKANMPRTRGWALSDAEAYDVAEYMNAQPRPDFRDKTKDWPKGGKPDDAPY
jgi:thiosulfate dehydrogenase